MPNLFLSGWWNQIQSQIFDDLYRSHLTGNNILYIPRAMYPNRFESCLEWIDNIFPKSHGYNVSVLGLEHMYNPKLIHQYDGLYIWWGNTFRLLHLLHKTWNDRLIEDFINNNKPIYWWSAGAIILWHDINTAPDMNITKLQYRQTLGFDTFWWYSIVCHYEGKQSDDNEIMEYITHYNTPVIALPEWVGCYFQDTTLLVWWSWSASIFTTQGKNIVGSGDKVIL